MDDRRPWFGSGRMWLEVIVTLVAVSLVYVLLGSHHTPVDSESPETDQDSIDAAVQVFGAVTTFMAAVVVVAVGELVRLVVRARRRARG